MDELIAHIPGYDRLVGATNAASSAAAPMTTAAAGGNNRPRAPPARRPPNSASATAATTSAASDPKQPRCYNCSRFGHLSADCPQPKRAPGSCFRCGSMGHRYSDCLKKTKTVAAVNQPEAPGPAPSDDVDEYQVPLLQFIYNARRKH